MQFKYCFDAVLKLDRVECLVATKGNLFHSDDPLWLKRAAHDLSIHRVCFSRTKNFIYCLHLSLLAMSIFNIPI